MKNGFWKNKTVFITGNTGFKGSWLTLWLRSLGAEVIGYSLPPPTMPGLFDLARADEGITMVSGDVRDQRLLLESLNKYRPQIVIHMAAQALVRESYLNPVETYKTNIMGTVYVLEAMRQVPGIRAAVLVASDKCYENLEQEQSYREEDPMGGHDPYSSSKGCSELIISAYRRSYFTKNTTALASARAGNVVGGGDWARDRLVVDAMISFMRKTPLIVRYPLAVRPWQHVLDPLHGYLLLAERLWEDGHAYASAWNFGPEPQESQPVSMVAGILCRYWGNEAKWTTENNVSNPHEAGLLFLDAGKARRQLKWRPLLNLDRSLAWTVNWYRAYNHGADMRRVTLGQLDEYRSLLENTEPCQNFLEDSYAFYPDHP